MGFFDKIKKSKFVTKLGDSIDAAVGHDGAFEEAVNKTVDAAKTAGSAIKNKAEELYGKDLDSDAGKVKDAAGKVVDTAKNIYKSVPVQIAVKGAQSTGKVLLGKIVKAYENTHKSIEDKAASGDKLSDSMLGIEETAKKAYDALSEYAKSTYNDVTKAEDYFSLFPEASQVLRIYGDEFRKSNDDSEPYFASSKDLGTNSTLNLERTGNSILMKINRSDDAEGLNTAIEIRSKSEPRDFKVLTRQLASDAFKTMQHELDNAKRFNDYVGTYSINVKDSASNALEYAVKTEIKDDSVIISYTPNDTSGLSMSFKFDSMK